MKEVSIEAIRVSLMNYNRVVVLKEKDADRYLTIYIGAAEADAIAIRLQDVSVARPMTHDLLTNVMSELGARVTRVVVSEVKNDTYFARLFLTINDQELEIDSRPSDAIALALRAGAPLFVRQSVADLARVRQQTTEGEATEAPAAGMDEQKMKEWLEELDPKALGKYEM